MSTKSLNARRKKHTDVKGGRYDGIDWKCMFREMGQRRAFVDTAMNLPGP